MHRFRQSVMVVLAVLVMASVVVLPPTGNAAEAPEGGSRWDLLVEVARYIQYYYLRGADDQSLWEGAIRGIMEALDDPYSEYLDPDSYDSFMSHFESDFGGVGMRVQKVGDYITVVAPIEGTPAYEAGVLAGDRIISVDGQDVVGADLNDVVSMIRGEPGTTVVIQVSRDGHDGLITLHIERAMVQVPSLDYELLEPGIGYLRLRSFSQKSGDEVRAAIEDLQVQGARAYVLDLRNNPGGLLSAAVEVAGQFLPTGTVVQVVDKGAEPEALRWNNTSPHGVVGVLINRGSASASEIVAGALQDRGFGVVMGNRSFGKGTVQSLIPLSNGGALKLTTAEYLLPSGRSINGQGLTPDITSPPDDADAQVEAAADLLRPMVALVDGTEEVGATFRNGQRTAIYRGGLINLVAPAFIEDGTFYLPVRSLEQLYGADILWDPVTWKVRVELPDRSFVLTPGSKDVTSDEVGASFVLRAPVIVRNGRTYVPARFLENAMNLMLRFDPERQSLKVY